MVVWVVLFFASVMAFALSAVSGGGAGLVLMPILGWMLVPESVPAALSIGTAVSSVSRIAFFSKIFVGSSLFGLCPWRFLLHGAVFCCSGRCNLLI